MIWRYTIVPRLVEPYLDIPADFSYLTNRRRPPPALLSVNHESRCTFLAEYLSFTIRNTPIYIHPILDTLAISSYITDAHTYASMMEWPLRQLISIVYLAPAYWIRMYTSTCRVADEIQSIAQSGYTGTPVVGFTHHDDRSGHSDIEVKQLPGITVMATRLPSFQTGHAPFAIAQADNMGVMDLDRDTSSVLAFSMAIIKVDNPHAHEIFRSKQANTLQSILLTHLPQKLLRKKS